MGGCANSKYAVDEDGKKTEIKETNGSAGGAVKAKKPFSLKKLQITKNGSAKKEEAGAHATNGDVPHKDIEFIDKAGVTTTTTTTKTEENENEDAKKEVTTYQTTVVKHTQKEGDELLQHLKDEAFRTLANTLKNVATTKTTSASQGSGEQQPVEADSSADELIGQVKAQVLQALGKAKETEIGSIIDSGAAVAHRG